MLVDSFEAAINGRVGELDEANFRDAVNLSFLLHLFAVQFDFQLSD